jgi:hypothetical protein
VDSLKAKGFTNNEIVALSSI